MSKGNRLESLAETLLDIKKRSGMLDFLYGILTPGELEEIPTRLEIVKMIKAGISQHKIAKELSVGISTVTRGSRELKKGRFKNI